MVMDVYSWPQCELNVWSCYIYVDQSGWWDFAPSRPQLIHQHYNKLLTYIIYNTIILIYNISTLFTMI